MTCRHATVQQREVPPLVNNRRRVVGPHFLQRPADVFVGSLAGLQRDVPSPSGGHCEHRPLLVLEVTGGDVEQAIGDQRRGDRQYRHPTVKMPQQVAIRGIRPVFLPAGHHDLGPAGVIPDERSRPGALFVTLDLPPRLPGGAVEGLDVGRLVVVIDIDDLATFDHRRRGGSVTELRLAGCDGVSPQQLATEVVTVKAQVTEEYVQALAVGRGRLGRVTALGMPRHLWLARMRLVLPDQLPRLQAQAIDHPVMNRVRRHRTPSTQVQSRLGLLVVGITVDRRNEHPVTPHDRAAPARSGNLGLPFHVGRFVPGVGQSRIVGHRAVGIDPYNTGVG